MIQINDKILLFKKNNMKKILYIHGLASSGATSTVRALQKLVGNVAKIVAPDIPIEINEAIRVIKEVCETEKPDLIIGSSLGGMQAQLIRGYKKILVNPAFNASQLLRKNIGNQLYFNARRDGATTFDITPQICEEYEAIEKIEFDGITPFDLENTYAYFATNDDVVNCKDQYLKHYKKAYDFEGEHRLTYSSIKNYLTPRINDILDIVCVEEAS